MRRRTADSLQQAVFLQSQATLVQQFGNARCTGVQMHNGSRLTAELMSVGIEREKHILLG
ncbi:hypothetical protein GCM10020370_51470 [Paenibacillus hodogayensis]